jgi:hypothetical protein
MCSDRCSAPWGPHDPLPTAITPCRATKSRRAGGGLRPNDIAVVCNEDGVALGLPENGCGLLGNWFFTRNNGRGDQVSLTPEDVTTCLLYWAQYRQVKHGGVGRMEVHSFNSLDEMEAFREQQRRDAREAN